MPEEKDVEVILDEIETVTKSIVERTKEAETDEQVSKPEGEEEGQKDEARKDEEPPQEADEEKAKDEKELRKMLNKHLNGEKAKIKEKWPKSRGKGTKADPKCKKNLKPIVGDIKTLRKDLVRANRKVKETTSLLTGVITVEFILIAILIVKAFWT